MTATSDELIAERRVRSAELALEAARRRLVEADQELTTLRERVSALETKLVEQAERHAAQPVWLKAELAAETRVRRVIEQALDAERSLRAELEDELRRRNAQTRAEGPSSAERELRSAQRHLRELDAELEIVRRHASEFEHSVRLAVREAWAWLTEMGERFTAALGELEQLRGPAAPQVEPLLATGRRGEPEWILDPAEVVPERFDEALSRLRSSVAPTASDEDPGPGS